MTTSHDAPPFVSVLIPALNEEHYIRKCLDSLLESGYSHDQLEIVVADGGSTDATREILTAYHAREPRVRWVDNPLKNQAHGVNAAAAAASPEARYFIRVDAHALYPPGFLPQVVAAARESGAELVVYVNEPHFETGFQRAVAFAFSHPLGVGDSLYRLGKFSGEVEHGQHGCFQRGWYERLGGYDPNVIPNEDAELSFRVRAGGGRVYLDQRLRMKYFPRRSLRLLARQYFFYGYGRALNCGKHRQVPRLRQLAPPLLVLGALGLLVAAPFWPWCLLLLAPYALLVLAVTVQAMAKTRSASLAWLSLVLPTMHHLWGAGFLVGCVKARPRGSVSKVGRSAPV